MLAFIPRCGHNPHIHRYDHGVTGGRGGATVDRRTRPTRGNDWLTYWFERSGFNKSELAAQVTALAKRRDYRHVCPDASRVRGWLAGEQPRPPVPQLLADVFSLRLGITLTPDDLGLRAAPPAGGRDRPPWVVTATVTNLIQLTRSDLMLGRRDVDDDAPELLTGHELLTDVQPWVTATPDPLPDRAEAPFGRIGMNEVAQIETVTQALRELDNLHGGGLAREAVIGHLSWAASLLEDAAYTDHVGRALFRAVADLAGVAGWMCFDVGLQTKALHYLRFALRAAKEAGDHNLGAHILNCMARQANHLKRPDDSLELVQLALYGARNTATPTMRAMLHSLEARAYAVTGQLADFTRAAGAAEDAFAHANPADDPVWITFFDQSEFYATIGMCHQIAAHTNPAHATQSVDMVSRAIATRPAGRLRSLAFDHIGLARTHLIAGDLDGADAMGTTALNLLPSINSARVRDRLAELRAETQPFAHVPVIGALRERLNHA
jgi:hypothetical protein